MEKRKLINYSIIALVIAFIVPLFVCPKCVCIQAKLGVSFTAMGAVAGVITLYIAISLYQKFGLESRFVERQADEIFKLVDILKGKVVKIHIRIEDKKLSFHYRMRFNIIDDKLKKEFFYLIMKNKIMLFDPNDYEKFADQLYEISKSYWLPTEIKEKLRGILLTGFGAPNEDTSDTNIFVKADFGNDPIDINYISFDLKTFDEFEKSKEDLIKTINNWLKSHCGIALDLKMEEPNPNNK